MDTGMGSQGTSPPYENDSYIGEAGVTLHEHCNV